MSRRRHKNRENALKIMYQLDVINDSYSAKEVVLNFLNYFNKGDLDIEFTKILVYGTFTHLSNIDKLITTRSIKWRIERMSIIDRNILRLGIYELNFLAKLPRNIILNEWIEIAKCFGTQHSSAFVNGVLANI